MNSRIVWSGTQVGFMPAGINDDQFIVGQGFPRIHKRHDGITRFIIPIESGHGDLSQAVTANSRDDHAGNNAEENDSETNQPSYLPCRVSRD